MISKKNNLVQMCWIETDRQFCHSNEIKVYLAPKSIPTEERRVCFLMMLMTSCRAVTWFGLMEAKQFRRGLAVALTDSNIFSL